MGGRVAGQASVRYGWPLQVIENVGHLVVVERPEAFLEALRAALGNADQRSHQAAVTTNRQERPMLHLISQDIKAIARRTLEEIFPRGDVAALAEVVHPNFVDHDGPPGAPPGLDGQVIAEDDTVVLSCAFHGRHTGEFMGLAPTSRSFAFRQVHIVRFQDGMGIEHWAVPDDLDLARQLGAIPRPPSEPVFADALAQLLSDLHP